MIARILQVLGLIVVAVGVGLSFGVGAGLIIGGMSAVVLGVALEREASSVSKPSA